MAWYQPVLVQLGQSGLFREVLVSGGKVRAVLDNSRFLDIYFDPTTKSYSYALIDLRLAYPGDKRVFGWDDYPHEGFDALRMLSTHPHHFQRRAEDGRWIFEESPMTGALQEDIGYVLTTVATYLQR